VIGGCGKSRPPETLGHLFDPLAAEGIDDAGLSPPVAQERANWAKGFCLGMTV